MRLGRSLVIRGSSSPLPPLLYISVLSFVGELMLIEFDSTHIMGILGYVESEYVVENVTIRVPPS
jgi:hypothetical protein